MGKLRVAGKGGKLAGDRHSSWFATVNTNRTDTALEQPLEDAMQEWFDQLKDRFITYRNGTTKAQIIDISGDLGIEVGPRDHKVHAHCLIRVTHRANIRLNYKASGASISERLGFINSVYFHCDLIDEKQADNELRHILSYIEKTKSPEWFSGPKNAPQERESDEASVSTQEQRGEREPRRRFGPVRRGARGGSASSAETIRAG